MSGDEYETLHPQRQLVETAKRMREWLAPARLRPLLKDENHMEESDEEWAATLQAAIGEIEGMTAEIVRLLSEHLEVVASTDDNWEGSY